MPLRTEINYVTIAMFNIIIHHGDWLSFYVNILFLLLNLGKALLSSNDLENEPSTDLMELSHYPHLDQ